MTNIDLKSLEAQQAELSSPNKLSLLHYITNHKKQVIALLGSAVILIGVTVNYLDVLKPSSDDVKTIKVQPTVEKTSINIKDMQFLAGTLLDTKNWAVRPVRSFIEQWNVLELDEKRSTKQLAWFQKFSTSLKNQIIRQRVLSDSGDQQATRRKTELLVLAASMGLSIPAIESINRDDKTQPSLAQTTPKEPPSPLAQTTPKEAPPPLAQATPNEPSPPLAQTTPKEQDITKLTTAKTSDIFLLGQEVNKAGLEDTIAKYIAAFESGQTSKIIDLFATDEYSSRKKPLTKIADEIAHMINSTVSRKTDLSAIKWLDNNRMVIGEGRYTSLLNPLDDGIKQQLTAHIQLTLKQVLNQTLITDFIVSEQTLVEISPPKISQQKLAKRDIRKKSNHESNALKAKSVYPTRAELKDLVNRYVKTYQAGDVKGLVALFTKNKSPTPAQVSRKEVLEYDYSELFESTAERRISITDLKWSYKNNKAVGKGNLTLQYNDEADMDTRQKGKILIVAERNQKRVELKNLFHIIEND